MAGKSRELRAASARWANGRRWGTATDAEATAFATERLANHIESIVAAAPPLSADQRARLTGLLAGDVADHGDDHYGVDRDGGAA